MCNDILITIAVHYYPFSNCSFPPRRWGISWEPKLNRMKLYGLPSRHSKTSKLTDDLMVFWWCSISICFWQFQPDLLTPTQTNITVVIFVPYHLFGSCEGTCQITVWLNKFWARDDLTEDLFETWNPVMDSHEELKAGQRHKERRISWRLKMKLNNIS